MESKTEKKVIAWADSIVKGPLKELGLLLGDSVRKWRFNNQLRILNGAYEKCKKYDISIQVISPKLLCPLLELSSLEDDPEMQDKWANLLTNMLDSEQNIQNHVLPILLSQISKNEFQVIEAFVSYSNSEAEKLTLEWENLEEESLKLIREQTQLAPEIISKYGHNSEEVLAFNDKYRNLITEINTRMLPIQETLLSLTTIEEGQLSSIELSNLTRLGILQTIPRSYATGRARSKSSTRIHVSVFHDGFDFGVTELGYELFRVCGEIQKPNE